MRHLCLFFIFSIAAEGQSIRAKSNSISVDYTESSSSSSEFIYQGDGNKKNKALIIGVSEYIFSGPRLQSLEKPTQVAQLVFDLITRNYGFSPNGIILLKNPTKLQMLEALDKITAESSEADNLFIFYSGHGNFDQKKQTGFWLPADAKIESPGTWVPNSLIKDYLKKIHAKHSLLVTDACFGGTIVNFIPIEKLTQKSISNEASRNVITSGNLSSVPDSGVFMDQFIKSLYDNSEKMLSSTHLFTRITKAISGNLQTPQFGVINETGDMGGDFIFNKK